MRYFISLFLIAILYIINGCKKDQLTPPYCSIQFLENGSKVVQGNSIEVNIIAISHDELSIEVSLYIDDVKIITFTEQPYQFIWDSDNYSFGEHTIKAVAEDETGARSEYEIIVEVVGFTPPETIIDERDGEYYSVVQIGEQVWMTENLRYNINYSMYPNNEKINSELYGLLYNTGFSVGDGLCPTGYHVPSKNDWFKLIEYLGGVSVAGGKLKEEGAEHWQLPNIGATNDYGFSALPAGSLSRDSIPQRFEKNAIFFTSFYSNYISMSFESESISILTYHPSGEYYSVRCIRDY